MQNVVYRSALLIACETIVGCSGEGLDLFHCCMLFHIANGCGLFCAYIERVATSAANVWWYTA